MMGVFFWYWWGDVLVKMYKVLYVDVLFIYFKIFFVKYRGIFLNDEDWGLKFWVVKIFEKECGNIGFCIYVKICELLLCLKVNYLVLVMYFVFIVFYQIFENKFVVDMFVIVMGFSYCEFLLLNMVSEWYSKIMGFWDYNVNKDKINEVLGNCVKENCVYENVYILVLRGLYDVVMGGGDVLMKEKVKMLENVLKDQRSLLIWYIDKFVEIILQVFIFYKEVLEIYLNGLELLDDVIIIWVDDNFGYMKCLSGF